MKIRKSNFTLIEILISMALMTIVLSVLSYFFYHINILNIASEKAQNKAFRLRYVESRLADILPTIIPPKDPQKDFYFFTASSSESIFHVGSSYLVFTFDNCVNLVDSLYSNHVLGNIFLDADGNLTLALSPSPKKWEANQSVPVQREVLLEGVESLQFGFYIPTNQKNDSTNKPSKKPKGLMEETLETSGGWVESWKYSYYQLPAMIKITLTMQDDASGDNKRVMVFPLANFEQGIIYR